VSRLSSWLRSDRDQRWVLAFSIRSVALGTHRLVRGFSLLRGNQVPPVRRYPNRIEKAPMNQELSPDEQREFWTQLFTVVIRREARKRAELEVRLELVEDLRQTEPRHL
jgi:hypothetical protein